MISVELLLKIIAAIGVVSGIIFTLVKGWRMHDRKIVEHEVKIESHDTKFLEQDEKLDEMERGFVKKIDELRDEMSRKDREDKRDHESIKRDQSELKSMVSRIDGYILGQQEKSA